MVVWEPVIVSDIAPPTTPVLALVPDTRTRQVWDASHVVSTTIRKSQGEDPGNVVWDWIALFPPGVRWDDAFPRPAFEGGEVVRVIGQVEEQLSVAKR
jgi:hypothetical protein